MRRSTRATRAARWSTWPGGVAQAAAGRTELARPWAGLTVQGVDGPLSEALGLPVPQGVLISALHTSSPFAKAGLDIGDVITAIGGLPVDGAPEMLFRLLTLGIGTETQVDYLRDGQGRTASVTLTSAPDDPPRAEIRIRARSILNGLSVANVNPAVIQDLRLPLEAQGVAVTDVDDISIRTRLRRGDLIRRINGQIVASTADVERAARARVAGYEIEVERGGQRGRVRLRNCPAIRRCRATKFRLNRPARHRHGHGSSRASQRSSSARRRRRKPTSPVPNAPERETPDHDRSPLLRL